MIFWLGYSSSKTVDTYNFDFNTFQLFWGRLNVYYPDGKLFGSAISFKDPIQNTFGDCYIISALTAIAQYPTLVDNTFLTK